MTVINNNNFLSPLNFKFSLTNSPLVNFFATDVNLPGMNVDDIEVPGATKFFSVPSTSLTFNTLSVTFKVDEDLVNYFEIIDWMFRMAPAEKMEDYNAKYSSEIDQSKKVYSDASLVITTSKRNPNIQISFKDCFPISVSDLQFSVSSIDETVIECTAEFKFTNWSYTRIRSL